MKLSLERQGREGLHFVGINEKGLTTEFGSSALGGESKNLSPMEHLLLSAAACTSIDIVLILKKMKQEVLGLKVEIEGLRREEVPSIFNKIHLHYLLKGKIDEKKANKAVELSVEKYCSVLTMLQHDASVSHSFEISE